MRPVDAPAPLAPSPPAAPVARRERDVTLSAFLVLLLASTALAGPLHDSGAEWLLTGVRLLALAAGVAAVAPGRGAVVVATLAALAVGVGQLVSGEHGPLELAARLAFYVVIGAALLARAFGPGRVTVHRILGAVSVYVLVAVAWGTAYQLLVVLRPGAIQGGSGPASLDDAMWLSFVTVTTTGYGDVLPASPLARSLASLEAIVGVLFPAILIARLVSLVQGPASPGEAHDEDRPAR